MCRPLPPYTTIKAPNDGIASRYSSACGNAGGSQAANSQSIVGGGVGDVRRYMRYERPADIMALEETLW